MKSKARFGIEPWNSI